MDATIRDSYVAISTRQLDPFDTCEWEDVYWSGEVEGGPGLAPGQGLAPGPGLAPGQGLAPGPRLTSSFKNLTFFKSHVIS